jgi:hypothetical protein
VAEVPDQTDKNPDLEKDASSLLKGILQRVEGGGEGASSKGASFPLAMILIGVAVLIISALGFLLFKARRRAALLASQLRRKEEEQKQAAEDHKLAQSGVERNAAHKRVKRLEEEIGELKEELAVVNREASSRAKTLTEATDWDDLKLVPKYSERDRP